MSKRGILIAVGSVLGFGAIAVVARAASSGGLLGPSVPVPSDEDLVAKYGINATHNNILTFASASLKAMRIHYDAFTNCAKYANGSSGGGAGSTALNFAVKGISAIPVIGGTIAGIVSDVAAVFHHHAQAVAAEQSAICAGTYAVNKTLDAIEAAYSSGNLQRSDYQAALQSLFSELVQMTAHVAQGCPPTTATGAAANHGNEACIVNRIFQAIAEKRLAQVGVVGGVS